MLCKILCHTLGKEAKQVDFLTQPLILFDTVASFREFLLKILEDNISNLEGEEADGLFGYSRLQEKELANGKQIIEAYLTILLKDTLYHNLRQFISVKWDPVEEIHLINFFEKWSNLIPLRLYNHILSSYVIPKLKQEMDKIDSKQAISHSFFDWVSPWVDILDKNSPKDAQTFRVAIRLKLVQFMKEWSPSNNELTKEIQKWRKLYDDNNWKSLVSAVVAKLAYHLKKLKINPQNQKIEPVSWVLKWSSHLDTKTMCTIFRENLIHNWVKT